MLKFKTKPIVVLLVVVLLACLLATTCFAANYRDGGTKGGVGASESYKESKYYENLSKINLTGDNPTDILAVALSQLGYQESNTFDNLGGEVSGTGNYTEYNYNFGDYGSGYSYYWCASFVSFCLYQAGCHDYDKLTDWCRAHTDDPNYIWKELGCEKWREGLCSAGYFRTAISYKNTRGFNTYYDPEYIPASGDLIFFKKSGSNTSGHIGIVLYSTSDTVYTVEGNTSSASGLEANGGGVYAKSYALNSEYILGYGQMPYYTKENVQKIDYSGKAPTTGYYIPTTNKYVFNKYSDAADESINAYNALLPKFTMFKVIEVTSTDVLLAQIELNGQTVTGYVRNNGDRIIQLTAETFENNVESDTDAVTEPETQTESITESVTETEIQTESITESVTEPETQTESITESVTETETQTESITESATEPETQTENITESVTEPETQTESITESATEPEIQTESITESATEPETQTESNTESAAEPETQTESDSESATEPETQTESITESTPETEITTDPTVESVSDGTPDGKSGGCGSGIGIGSFVIISMIGASFIVFSKPKRQ